MPDKPAGYGLLCRQLPVYRAHLHGEIFEEKRAGDDRINKDTGADKQVCPCPCLCIVATIIANIDNICIYRYNSSSLHDATQTQDSKRG